VNFASIGGQIGLSGTIAYLCSKGGVVHGKRTSTAVKTKELRQVGNRPPGPLAFDFY